MTPCPTFPWGAGTDSDSYGLLWTPDALEQDENTKSARMVSVS